MDEVINNELVDHLEELSTEADHNIAIMDGVIDTVSGNEGMDLTAAQHYLHGVMYAHGAVPLNRAGNEGILTKIKTFIQAAILMVKEFFHKIWGFFFGDRYTREQKRLKKLLEAQISELGGVDKHRDLNPNQQRQMQLLFEAFKKKEQEHNEKLEAVFEDANNSGKEHLQMWIEFSRHDDMVKKAMSSELDKKSYDTAGEAIEFLRNALHVNDNMGKMLSEGQKLIRMGEQAIKIGESSLKGEEDKEKLEKGQDAMQFAKLSMRAVKILVEAMKDQVSAIDHSATHLRAEYFK